MLCNIMLNILCNYERGCVSRYYMVLLNKLPPALKQRLLRPLPLRAQLPAVRHHTASIPALHRVAINFQL